MRAEDNQAHAIIIYQPTDIRHFFALFWSILLYKMNRYDTLTTHLPFEAQHPNLFSGKRKFIANQLIMVGEALKSLFSVTLYWENCPIFNTGTWDLKYGQTEWENIPTQIDLCLDTGHLMMGSKNKYEARARIKKILQEKGEQIKYLHIHENNLIKDQHVDPRTINSKDRVLTKELIVELQEGRKYIFEKST